MCSFTQLWIRLNLSWWYSDVLLYTDQSALPHTAKTSQPISILTAQFCLIIHLFDMVPAAFSPDSINQTLKQTTTASISTMQVNWKVTTQKEWQNYELHGTKLIDDISRAANSVETM